MDLKKALVGVLLTGSVYNVMAVECQGVPTAVKMGEYGGQESLIFVKIDELDFSLGRYDDPQAKFRISLAQSALVAGREMLLRFYAPAS